MSINLKSETVKEIHDRVKPDTFVVFTTRQVITGPNGAALYGSPEVFDRVMRTFYNNLQRRLYGRNARRRRRDPIWNITTVERGGDGRWHIHACIRRPPGVTIEKFRIIAEQCWKASQWSLPLFQIDEYVGGGVSYILKQGQDSILTTASKF